MTDLEEQLGATLVAVADDAPLGPDLADAARRRHRARRHRRLALVGTAVVVAVIAGVVTLATGGDAAQPQVAQDPATASTTPVAPGWRTVTVEDVAVDVPQSWQVLDCPLSGVVFGPPGTRCAKGPSVSFLVEALVDMLFGPNEITDGAGYVVVDRLLVLVHTDSNQFTRRILSTARLTLMSGGEATNRTGLDEVRTFEHDGVTVTVLSSWFAKDCAGLMQITPRVDCSSSAAAEGVYFLDARSFRPRAGEGVVAESQEGGTALWGGHVLRGDYAIFVAHPDKQTAEKLLNLVR